MVQALTDPNDVRSLCYLRAQSIARERVQNTHWWEWALETWHCDVDPTTQDVCGPPGSDLGTWGLTGQWEHIYCRDSEPYTKNGVGSLFLASH